MQGKERKIFLAIAAVFSAAFVVLLLAVVGPLDLPGSWRTTLGLEDEYPPCAPGLYHESPTSPPQPAGHWRFEPESPRAEVENSAVAIGPIVYSTNGQTGNFRRVLAYDTRSRRWSEPTRSPIGLNHSQAAAYEGDIYLAGGYRDGEEATDSFLRYEPKEDRWTELPPLQQARGAAAAAVVGDRLYVVGGSPQIFGRSVGGEPYDSLEIYDFRAKEWSSGADIPEPRHHFVAAGLGGKLYVAGGRRGLFEENNSLPPTDAFDRYDPLTDEWETPPPHPDHHLLRGNHHRRRQGRGGRRREPDALGGRRRLGDVDRLGVRSEDRTLAEASRHELRSPRLRRRDGGRPHLCADGQLLPGADGERARGDEDGRVAAGLGAQGIGSTRSRAARRSASPLTGLKISICRSSPG